MALIRYQALHASKSGRFPGVFALVNGLEFDGVLSASERRWWQANNQWFESSQLTDPFKNDPSLSDRSIHPHTSSWFRSEATEYVDRVSGYLDILIRHRVAWIELRSETVGPELFADKDQVLVSALHDPSSLGPNIEARRWHDGVKMHGF